MFQIDLNADLGEASGPWELSPDRELLGLVSSASIACGSHAGDPILMRRTAAEAGRLGVTVGAHPGYPDRTGFGRRDMNATPAEVGAYVAYQVGALMGCAAAEGVRVRYVKPHGALYNRAARDAAAARAIADAVRAVDSSLAILALAGSALADAARAVGLRAVPEAFLDRGYADDGSLLPRDRPGAVIDDPDAAAERALRLARDGAVAAGDGSMLRIQAESYCVHGDGPNAAELLRAVRARLGAAGIAIAPFIR
ncbi:MAG: LamB/YcsF family protein [Gemmatimonadales bacterium]